MTIPKGISIRKKRQYVIRRSPPSLSPRHVDVLKAWWASEPVEDTAFRLGIKVGTVRMYRDQARLRLNYAPDLQAACKRAVEMGLLRWQERRKIYR